LSISQDEVASLAPRDNDDPELSFRRKYLSSKPVKPIAV